MLQTSTPACYRPVPLHATDQYPCMLQTSAPAYYSPVPCMLQPSAPANLWQKQAELLLLAYCTTVQYE